MAISPLGNAGAQSPSSPSSTPLNLSPEKREHYKALWQQYGWNQVVSLDTILNNHPDFFTFLRSSKVMYAIRGYQHSLQKAENTSFEAKDLKEGFKYQDGQPLLFKEGQWVSWKDFQEEVVYSSEKKHLVSKQDENIEWSYFYPQGFIPRSGKGYNEPIYQLTAEEMGSLRKIAKTTEEKKHVIQVFTTQNKATQRVSHSGLRIVREDGSVFSFSFATPDAEVTMDRSSAFDFLATYKAVITSPDFVEFDKFISRRVTSIAISDEALTTALEKIKNYSATPLRFNFIHQNCSTFVADILTEIGIEIDVTCWVGEFAWDLAKGIPILGCVVRTIDSIATAIIRFVGKITPKFIQAPIKFVARIIFYIPFKILTILRNFLILSLGGAKVGVRPPPGMENQWDNSERLTGFHRHINSWKDIFKDDIGKIHSTAEIMHWQLGAMKDFTFVHKYEGSPQFMIAPKVTG